MSKLETTPSANGKRNLAISKVENDLDFIVGDNLYSCPEFVADFLLSKIAQLHAINPSIYEFHVQMTGVEAYAQVYGEWRALVDST
jgi:hypothetical protein